MALQKINDYNVNLELVIEQFKNKDNINGLIRIANNSANDIETALFEIEENFYIDNAIGLQLNIIGDIFQEERLGRTDTEYRAAIKQKGALSYSGEPESIIEILKASYGATYVEYSPLYPGKYQLITDIAVNSGLLDPISPAGVQGIFLTGLCDANDNPIHDANDEWIHVATQLQQELIADALGNELVDANGNNIIIIKDL